MFDRFKGEYSKLTPVLGIIIFAYAAYLYLLEPFLAFLQKIF